MGRPAEPTALKLIKGTRKDRVNTREPKPAASPPKARGTTKKSAGTTTPTPRVTAPPMNRRARAVWNRLAPDLIAQAVLTSWDVDLFAEFCKAVVLAKDAELDIVKRGPLVKGAEGLLVKNPAVQIGRDAVTTMTTIGGQFGLTPSARAKISHPEASKNAQGAAKFFTA